MLYIPELIVKLILYILNIHTGYLTTDQNVQIELKQG